MADQSLPDYYLDLGVKSSASQQEIECTYAKRVAELRSSAVEDAPEELAEVEAAYAVLRDPAQRAAYDAKVREEDKRQEEEDDAKNPEQKEYRERSSRRRRHLRTRRTGGWLDAIWMLLKLFK